MVLGETFGEGVRSEIFGTREKDEAFVRVDRDRGEDGRLSLLLSLLRAWRMILDLPSGQRMAIGLATEAAGRRSTRATRTWDSR